MIANSLNTALLWGEVTACVARKIRYLDEPVLRTVSGISTTTHVNLQGYKLRVEDLQKLADAPEDRCFFYMGHDTDNPPVGRVTKTEIRELKDGEFGLWNEIVLFNEEAVRLVVEKGQTGLSIGFRESNGG